MTPSLTLRACAAVAAGLLCAAALAAGDASPKPPTAPPATSVDKSARCLPEAVNKCRSGCDTKKFEAPDKTEIAKKIYECKQDCIRAC